MSTTPTISVLMPVYNSAPHLRQAMDSILGQTFSDFEFLCINDGSTDESATILSEYAQADSRVRVITQANGGVTRALNAGLQVARGEFVARMDADDMADPSRLAEQLAYLKDHAECVAVGCHVIHMDGNGVEMHRSPPYTTHDEICACLWEGNSSALPHYGAFMRRDVLAASGNYREEFRTAQDLDLFLRLSEVGKLANVPQYLMRYRVHEGSVGAKKAGEQAKNAREILRQAYARRGLKLPKHLAKWDNVVVATNRLKWGWTALQQGRYSDARGHAWNVLRRKPFRKFAWQLALHALLGPTRGTIRKLLRGDKKKPLDSIAEKRPAASVKALAILVAMNMPWPAGSFTRLRESNITLRHAAQVHSAMLASAVLRAGDGRSIRECQCGGVVYSKFANTSMSLHASGGRFA